MADPDYVRGEDGEVLGYVREGGSFAEHAFGHGAPSPFRKHDRTWNDDQQLGYVYVTDMLPKINPRGVSSTSRPTPLTRDQIMPVLRAISEHENYRGQILVMHDEDFTPHVFERGEFRPPIPATDLAFPHGVPMPKDLARIIEEVPPGRASLNW